MDELEALSVELRRHVPVPPVQVLEAQRARLRLDPRARIPRPRRGAFWIAAWASAALGLASLLFVLWSRSTPEVFAPPIELVAREVEVRHTLSDGSVIRLERNARGKLERRGAAEVVFALERGRASFSVTPNAGRVFRVSAGRYEVKVLGTVFSVGYDASDAISVEVERGAVSVQEAFADPVRLNTGDRFEARRAARQVSRATRPAPPANTDAASGRKPEARAPAPAAVTPPATRPAAAPSVTWRDLYLRRDYAGALAAARLAGLPRLIAELGPAELADLADATRLGGDLSAALSVLHALERRFPSAPAARHSAFLIGRVLAQSGRRNDAVSAFERYLSANPDGAYSLETMGRLMELYTQRGNTQRARGMAERYLERAPSGPYQRLARSLASPR